MYKLIAKMIRKIDRDGGIHVFPDFLYLKALYYLAFDKKLNLKEPCTFNEKLQWLKLNTRNPNYTQMVDKNEVKKYVANIIGEKYIIPTLDVLDSVDEIDLDKLPKQFVIKCTHDSGGIVVCKDKSKLNFAEIEKKINLSLKKNFYWHGREWPYKNVVPKIIIEQYIEDLETKELRDYKVHNFNNGEQIILVCRDRFSKAGMTEDFFDENWNHLNIKRPGHEWSEEKIKEPENLEEMLELSRELSKDIPFLRTDFYEVNHKLYFGELTFFPSSGFIGFEPNEWDKIWGDKIIIDGEISR